MDSAAPQRQSAVIVDGTATNTALLPESLEAGYRLPVAESSVRAGWSRFLAASSKCFANAVGGFTAAVIQIPVDCAYGVIALAPLGPEFAAVGMLSALYTASISNAAGALAGSRRILGGPRTSLTLLVAALCAVLATHPAFLVNGAIDLPKVMGFLSLGLLLAGLLQVAFGHLRWGSLAKFIPYPVRAGLMVGIALLLFASALRPMLGLPDSIPWSDLQGVFAQTRVGDLAVTALVLLLMFRPLRFIPLPATLVALAAGILLFHGLAVAFPGDPAGTTMALISAPIPGLEIPQAWLRIAGDPALSEYFLLLVPFVLSLALLGTLDSLISASQVDGLIGIRRDSDREASAQGWANVAGALVGAQPSGASVPRTMICYAAGGRSQSAVYFYSLFIAAGALFAPHLLTLIPMSAVAAIIAASSLSLIDDWSRHAPRLLLRRGGLQRAQRRLVAANYAVMLLVASTMVVSSISAAVMLGLLVSMVLFVRSNSRAVVRSVVRGDARRSIKIRNPEAMQQLAVEGRRIALLTLEGALFFGTADQLADRIHEMTEEVDFVVLDLKRLTEIDPTGARILQQIARGLNAKGKTLVLCEPGPMGLEDPKILTVESMQIDGAPRAYVYQPDVDRALEWAEDRVLEDAGVQALPGRPLQLAETLLGDDLTAGELECLSAAMTEEHYEAGQYIFHEGDHGDALYLSTSGEISILLPVKGVDRARDRGKRIISFAPGVVFGELAVLEGKPRSADAMAEVALTVIRLSTEDFDRLRLEQPALAAKVLRNLGRYLSARMRSLTVELSAALSA